MKSSVVSLAASVALQYAGGAQAGVISPSSPSVQIKNGTVHGFHDSVWDQDYFRGIPFARPPVGDLRFRPPQYINTKLGNIVAKEYGPHCFGYGWDQEGYEISEDCLTLNIIRPAGISQFAKLPVAVWIHGGGFFAGGGADRRYNMTWMVDQSKQVGLPIIGVSINYRLSGWGFIAGAEAEGTKNLNVGLKDQRLALHWVKENIKKFGGDPDKVTIFGESAGGASVGMQMVAYNGKHDNLFRGVVAQSGGPIYYGPSNSAKDFQEAFDQLAAAAGCTDAESPLNCLRQAPVSVLNATIANQNWQPVIDGEFLTEFGSVALKNQRYAKVPLIIGTTRDEGASFGAIGANNDQDIANWLAANSKWSPATIQQLISLYPADVSVPPAENFTDPDDGTNNGTLEGGLAYHRAAAFVGDLMFIANRRYVAEILASQNVPVWSYVFRVTPNGLPNWRGSGHFSEIPYVFHDLAGQGYTSPYDGGNPLGGPQAVDRAKLAKFVSRSWIRFIAKQDPKYGAGPSEAKWLPYDQGSVKRQMVFDIESAGGSYMETDDFRAAGIAFMNQYSLQTWR